MAAAKSRLRSKQESTESYKDLSVSSSVEEETNKIPKELLLDLSFLTDQERRTLVKVIRADQEFRKATLETVKKNIEKGRRFQEFQKSETENNSEKCTCCGLVLKSICSKTGATKCSSCQNVVCKKCRKGDNKSSTCVLCIKEKLMDLQTMDYMPVLTTTKGLDQELTEERKLKTTFFSGSELLKESLAQDSVSATAVEKPITIQEKSRTIEPPSVLGPLNGPVLKQKRSKSLEPAASTDSQQAAASTDVNDPASGFKLIRRGQSEEGLDDLGSLYSEPDYDSETISGKIKLGIWYKTDDRTLFVRVAEGKDLSSINDGKPDPYVRMHLLPDKTKLTKRRSSIQRKTKEPKFDEILKYGKLDVSDLSLKTLWVTVWHWDRHGKNQFLGEIRLPLSTLDLTNTSNIWYNLHEYMDDSDIDDIDLPGSKGKLQLALKYSFNESTKPSSSLQRNVNTTMVNVHIKLKKAEGLPEMVPGGSSNPFVRAYLLPNKFAAAKKKTKVIFNNLNPVWEEELVYSMVSLDELETSRVLELTLWDHDRRGINSFIGGLRIGPDPIVAGNPKPWMDSTANESSHWEAMLSQHGEWVEQWHELRPSMHPQQLIKQRRKTSMSQVNVNIKLASLSSSAAGPVDRDRYSVSPLAAAAGSSNTKSAGKKLKLPPPSISISRGARGDYKISGEVLVGIEYKESELHVRINRAIKLAAVGKTGTSNPYIKIYLLPDSSKKSKLKTSIKKKTLDPVFNEKLQYKISEEEVTSRAMWLTVWSAGRLGNQFLGEVCIPLGSLDLSDPGEQWYQLHDFYETGVILPPQLSSSHDSTHSRPSSASPSHRQRSHAFSRGSLKSASSGGSHDTDSFESFVPATSLAQSTRKSLPHQISLDSDTAQDYQHLVIPQGEKRGSADSIIPVITIGIESDKES